MEPGEFTIAKPAVSAQFGELLWNLVRIVEDAAGYKKETHVF
jgi:hypothetical protein